MAIITGDSEVSVSAEAAQRLAIFGFGSVQNLAVYNASDIDIVTSHYIGLDAAPMGTTLSIRLLHFATQGYHPVVGVTGAAVDGAAGAAQWQVARSVGPASGATPTPLQFQLPPELVESLRVQSQAVERANKRARPANPHLGRDSEDIEDEAFDIQGALRRAGLDNFDRPEHIHEKFYAAAKKACAKAHAKGRPWVSDKTTDLLHSFAPYPSDRFDPDPTKAQHAAKRN